MSPIRLLIVVSAILALVVPALANKPAGAELTFVYLRDNDTTIMSGRLSDLSRVKKRLAPRGLWVRMADGKELVIRDAATLDQFDAAWKPANMLAERQGTLGSKQGLIGARQGALGTKQGAIGMKQGALGQKQAALEMRADSATPSERAVIAKKRAAIESEMRDLDQRMRMLDEQMRALDKPMQELGNQMEIVGAQHEAAAKQAQVATEALIARAIASGVAKPF